MASYTHNDFIKDYNCVCEQYPQVNGIYLQHNLRLDDNDTKELDIAYYYTHDGFFLLNNYLREALGDDEHLSALERALNYSLDFLKSKQKTSSETYTLYRGTILEDLEKYKKVGSKIKFSEFISTSTEINIARRFRGNVFIIFEKCKEGIDITSVAKNRVELEILFKSNSEFTVIKEIEEDYSFGSLTYMVHLSN